MKTRHKIMSFLLSGAMVFSLLPASAIGTVKAASVNYALTATATASGSETSAFGPEKAKDGDTLNVISLTEKNLTVNKKITLKNDSKNNKKA